MLKIEVGVEGAQTLDGGSGSADLDAQRERAEELGGSWTVSSADGSTRITAVLPVTEEVAGVR
ncbi:hypothetical protein [Naasia aerilata]|uniref:hypothetical protein n=1 Tax=Naasia aerilata TaxID=1162966 RepID=UPI0025744591|nr:hypothetical protein [Naasia aerilata]